MMTPSVRRAAAGEVEFDAVHIDVAAAVDHDLVAGSTERAVQPGHSGQIGMLHERATRLAPQQRLARDQQAAVGQPRDGPAHVRPARRDDLAVAGEVDSEDLLAAPV
jgi:hypothetical protein